MFQSLSPFPSLRACSAILITLAFAAHASAVEDDLRIVAQVQSGTAGFEPGVALEWRSSTFDRFVIRPELNLSEDQRIGGGAALLYSLRKNLDLPAGQDLNVGPRVVAHNSDDTGLEVDLMATYSFALGDAMKSWRHAVGLLGTVGMRDDRKHDETRLGASGGAFYSYRF